MSYVVPDACTLPTAEQPFRLREFDALFSHLREIEQLSLTHTRLKLTGEPGLADTTRDLTARETECCSFFTFGVTGEDPVVLDIEVPPQHGDVLAALTQRARGIR
ncbi:hypothetical protein AB0J80_03650 [Actinoplanes sp. NPDC049548]|uniref:hypothetical protein n=1 Tax=Actinoplanes sp. NPDC049548 TaxID=3155152 RepID=UPI0034259941